MYLYCIWRERNNRLFNGKECNEDILVRQIQDMVKMRIVGLIEGNLRQVKRMKQLWDLGEGIG